MTYQQIKSFINTYIVQNGVNAITGLQLNTVLNELADYKGFDSVVVTTLPAGSDATATVQGMTLVLGIPKGADGRDGIDGIDGIDGQDAVNPFKGWFTTDNIPTTGQAGDYCNVSDTSVTPHTVTIYRWNTTTNQFEDTGEVPDTTTGETFASSETLQEVAIDDSHLVNPVNTADSTQPVLAQAEDVMQLKAKLKGVTAEEKKVTNIQDWHPDNTTSGYYDNSGVWQTSASIHSTRISVVGYKSVRFQGYAHKTTSVSYAFVKEDGTFCSGFPKSYKDASLPNNNSVLREYKEVIPDDAVYLVCVDESSKINQSNFYCYLQSGESVENIKEDVEGIHKEVYGYETEKFNDEAETNSTDITGTYVINTSNVWASTTAGKSAYFTVIPNSVIKIKSTSGCGFALLRDVNNVGGNNTPHFAYEEGFDKRLSLPANGEMIIHVPSSATCLWFMKKNAAGTTTYDFSLYLQDGYEHIDGLSDKVDDIDEEVNGSDDDLGLYKEMYGYIGDIWALDNNFTASRNSNNKPVIINAYNKWHQSAADSAYMAVNPGDKIKIDNIGETSCFYALLTNIDNMTDAVGNTSVTPAFATGYDGRIVLSKGNSVELIIPEDAHYLYKTTKNNYGKVVVNVYKSEVGHIDGVLDKIEDLEAKTSGIETKNVDTYYDTDIVDKTIADSKGNTLRPLSHELVSGGATNRLEVVDTLQQQNAIKKDWQLRYLEWTPKKNVPYRKDSANPDGEQGDGTFSPGVKVTGAPYSSVKELDKYIGTDVSIHTFMTAVNNQYSLLYTEDVRDSLDGGYSAWGKTYHGTNCATYFGTVCSMFTSYCVGWPMNYATDLHKWLANYAHKAVKLYEQNRENLKVGDIIVRYQDGDAKHCMLVSGIERSSATGLVTRVRIAESTGSHVTESYWQLTTLGGNYVAYRSLELYRNIDYVPSPYIPLTSYGEEEQQITYNNDICCFAGDKATFRTTDLIAIDYNLNNDANFAYTTMKIEKLVGNSWTLVNTIDLSDIDTENYPIPQSQVGHVVNLGEEHEYGHYRAYLVDALNDESEPTEWEVLDTTVEVGFDEITPTNLKFTFSSANATPIGFKIVRITGGIYCMREFTNEELASGEVCTDIRRLMREQLSTHDGETGYLKVVFKGNFGRVTNSPIEKVI